ncbi:hypothetical protein LX36DRAFT_32816 [Colletotrichum falcatum]|nr:hypothetical protein LX36DRAFT_32816 [Colletotrichum falcatum]
MRPYEWPVEARTKLHLPVSVSAWPCRIRITHRHFLLRCCSKPGAGLGTEYCYRAWGSCKVARADKIGGHTLCGQTWATHRVDQYLPASLDTYQGKKHNVFFSSLSCKASLTANERAHGSWSSPRRMARIQNRRRPVNRQAGVFLSSFRYGARHWSPRLISNLFPTWPSQTLRARADRATLDRRRGRLVTV